MENDPIFSNSTKSLTLEEIREKSFDRVKRLFEYDFGNCEAAADCGPLAGLAQISALLPIDGSMNARYGLSVLVRNISLIASFLS